MLSVIDMVARQNIKIEMASVWLQDSKKQSTYSKWSML